MTEPVAVAVLAKAPVAGLAKTRLISTVGAHAAAVLQDRLTERAIETATAAEVGPVTLWCTPSLDHGSFQDLAARFPLQLKQQPDGDLGTRMLAAIAANDAPTLVIGTDCPALAVAHLRAAADALASADVVMIPAEDGGYVLIGTRSAQPVLFERIEWGTGSVMNETRARIRELGLQAVELPALWDVDTAHDLERLEREHPELAL